MILWSPAWHTAVGGAEGGKDRKEGGRKKRRVEREGRMRRKDKAREGGRKGRKGRKEEKGFEKREERVASRKGKGRSREKEERKG